MRAWLHRILRNTFASRYRKRRREREVIERAHSEGALLRRSAPREQRRAARGRRLTERRGDARARGAAGRLQSGARAGWSSTG